MPDEPEEGFTVRDRRRFLTEDEAVDTTPTSEISAPEVGNAFLQESDEISDTEEEYNGALPDVYSVLALFMGELRNLAWMRMGLIANPGTGEIERDLPQAKIAIDTVAFLATQIDPVVAPEERMPLKAMVTDLQVNFIEQSKRGA